MSWVRVHQGGHHDIWCDGVTHKAIEGGFCHPDRGTPGGVRKLREDYSCDCAKWQIKNENPCLK